MTMQECYEAMGGNYTEALSRMYKEELVKKFAGMFLKDTSFANLTEAMAEGNTELAFRAAHTMKGVCQNLAFEHLYEPVINMTEALRGGDMKTAETFFPELKEKYELTVETIQKAVGE